MEAIEVGVDELKKYIDDNTKNIISDLAGFIKIPSVSSDKKSVDKALDYALELGKKMGFSTKAVCNHQVGVIEIGEGDETIGILSHVDVVPTGGLESWNSDPFDMDIRDGKLYGRGTMDDKGAIIISLYAMKAVVESGEKLHKKIQMILGTQEEVDWVDMNAYVKEYPLPDYGFTPDGEFPLCNIEKGLMDIPMHFKINLDAPKDGWYLININAGVVENAVPGKCTAVTARYENGIPVEKSVLVTEGKTVHSCQPEKGENAIFNMAKKIKEMDFQDNKLLQLLMMTKEKFGSLYGKEIGLYSKSEMYNGEFVHRNVFAPTLFKTTGNDVLIHVNARFAYGTPAEGIRDVFEKLVLEYGGTLGDVSSMPAVYVGKDRKFMPVFADAYEKGSGRKNEFVLAYGGSYAKAIPNIVSWGPIFPGDEDTCHEDNEYITIKSLLDNGKIFSIALSELALSEKHFK